MFALSLVFHIMRVKLTKTSLKYSGLMLEILFDNPESVCYSLIFSKTG